jgi:8-oxo-dGTP diphosphatase
MRARRPRVVVAGLIERGRRLLISQRAAGPFARHWEFPGGKREADESDAEALARELREELGIEVEIGPLVHIARAGPLELRFLGCRWLPRQRPRPIESAQFRWVRRGELDRYRFPPADAELIGHLLSGRLQWAPGDRPDSGGWTAAIQSTTVVTTEVDMAKAKRARRTSFRTMESDTDALSVLERLEQLEAEERAAAAASEDDAPAAPADPEDES